MPPQQRDGLLDLLMKRVGLGGHWKPRLKYKSFLVIFFKKEQRFFLKKEAKTFHPIRLPG
jgi:hypothetical protein